MALQNREEWCIISKTARFHQPVMHSSKMYTEDICKVRYGRQHCESHHQIWTQQSMVGSLTTSVFCSHEQCHLVHCRHRQKYCSSFGATARPLDVELLLAAAPSYDARYFVPVKVGKLARILLHNVVLN